MVLLNHFTKLNKILPLIGYPAYVVGNAKKRQKQ